MSKRARLPKPVVKEAGDLHDRKQSGMPDTDDEYCKIIVHISETLDKILLILKKPESKFGEVLETAGAIVSVMGILSIIDIIRNWLGL